MFSCLSLAVKGLVVFSFSLYSDGNRSKCQKVFLEIESFISDQKNKNCGCIKVESFTWRKIVSRLHFLSNQTGKGWNFSLINCLESQATRPVCLVRGECPNLFL